MQLWLSSMNDCSSVLHLPISHKMTLLCSKNSSQFQLHHDHTLLREPNDIFCQQEQRPKLFWIGQEARLPDPLDLAEQKVGSFILRSSSCCQIRVVAASGGYAVGDAPESAAPRRDRSAPEVDPSREAPGRGRRAVHVTQVRTGPGETAGSISNLPQEGRGLSFCL